MHSLWCAVCGVVSQTGVIVLNLLVWDWLELWRETVSLLVTLGLFVFVLFFLLICICVPSNVNVCFIFFLAINGQGYLMDTQFLLGIKIL